LTAAIYLVNDSSVHPFQHHLIQHFSEQFLCSIASILWYCALLVPGAIAII
ncbi:MAG: hypothetical protein ACI8SJ_000582, partial [Shewanella sp.]